jgi:cytochrome c-type biogenesis protein CcmF
LIYLRENLVYGIPAQINDLNLRVRINQEAITAAYPRDDQLPYDQHRLKQGESVDVGEWHIRLLTIGREASHPHYIPAEDDIAVNAILEVSNGDTSFTAQPLFYIRGKTPGHLKAYFPEIGLHIRFENIYPQSEEFDFSIALAPPAAIPIEIAGDVPRTDIIVLEAIVFPGINLFWLGSLMMMSGLFLGMWRKRREQKARI